MLESKFILVVEDDSVLGGSIVTALNAAGYKAFSSTDVREATFKLKNQAYACVLLDIKLGADSGTDLVSFVRDRKDSLNRTTPIILVSGNLDREVMTKVLGQVQGALVKPFDMASLLEIVKKHAGPPPPTKPAQ